MSKEKEKEIMIQFVRNFELAVSELVNYSGYLQLSEESEKVKDEALKILQKKVKKMKKAETTKELKKHVRINRVLDRFDI